MTLILELGPESERLRFAKAAEQYLVVGLLLCVALATYRLGQAYWALGDYRRATEFLSQTTESLQGDLIHERFGQHQVPAAASRTWSAECLAKLGCALRRPGGQRLRHCVAARRPRGRVVALRGRRSDAPPRAGTGVRCARGL